MNVSKSGMVVVFAIITSGAVGQVTGSGTTSQVPKFTGATTVGNSAITDSNGSVGIRTTSPIAPLHVLAGNDGTTGQANCGAESASCPASAASGYGFALDSDYTSGQYRWRWEPVDRGWNISLYLQQTQGTANAYSNVVRFGSNQFDPNNAFAVFGNSYLAGSVGIGTASPGQKLEVNGSLKLTSGSGGSITFSDGTNQTTAWTGALCGGDYAESVDVSTDRTQYQPGDVLVIDDDHPGNFLKSAQPYSRAVAGIYSTKPGVVGRRQQNAKTAEEIPMAMIGIVPVKVTAENGPIHLHDLLVSSSTPGYAMKGTDRDRMLGAVIGKALGPLSSGTGTIEVLVSLQ